MQEQFLREVVGTEMGVAFEMRLRGVNGESRHGKLEAKMAFTPLWRMSGEPFCPTRTHACRRIRRIRKVRLHRLGPGVGGVGWRRLPGRYISIECSGGERRLKPGFQNSDPHSTMHSAPCMSLGKVLEFSEPPFSHMLNRGLRTDSRHVKSRFRLALCGGLSMMDSEEWEQEGR